MTTEMISLSEYRKNISKLIEKMQSEDIEYLITIHGKPVGIFSKPKGKTKITI